MQQISSPQQRRRQTTVLVGGCGSNGIAAALCSILGDVSNIWNTHHVIRVLTPSPQKFIEKGKSAKPRVWRCHERKATTWKTHVGAPDAVFGYSDDDDDVRSSEEKKKDLSIQKEVDPFERAISGVDAHDDGGIADAIILCCSVSDHMPILRRVARALFQLQADDRLLTSPSAPPLFIGTLYGGGGFDWMCRLAFGAEKPSSFDGMWKRELALFGLMSFPFLVECCEEEQEEEWVEEGVVTLHKRIPEMRLALCPATPRVRTFANIVLGRVLQCMEAGRQLAFLGLSSTEELGGDGSAALVDAAAVTSMSEIWDGLQNANKNKKAKSDSAYSDHPRSPSNMVCKSMADGADPNSALAFLACTINATHQILHPCIVAASFHDKSKPAQSNANDGSTGDASIQKATLLTRFYNGDGASKAKASRLITTIVYSELHLLMDCLDAVLAPFGTTPISSQHGTAGDLAGLRFLSDWTGNTPRDVGQRSGLTDMVLRKQQLLASGETLQEADEGGENDSHPVGGAVPLHQRLNYHRVLETITRLNLSNNTNFGLLSSSPVRLPDANNSFNPSSASIRRDAIEQLLIDDIPHGLCVHLGLAELLGFNLELDMAETLNTVRMLQQFLDKEYVLPSISVSGCEESVRTTTATMTTTTTQRRIVTDARDLGETSSPQAFGIGTIQEFKIFLSTSPFGEEVQRQMEVRVKRSVIFTNKSGRSELRRRDMRSRL